MFDSGALAGWDPRVLAAISRAAAPSCLGEWEASSPDGASFAGLLALVEDEAMDPIGSVVLPTRELLAVAGAFAQLEAWAAAGLRRAAAGLQARIGADSRTRWLPERVQLRGLAAEELATLLGWSHGRAERLVGEGLLLSNELQLVDEELRRGSIDAAKAGIFCSVLGDQSLDVCLAVCDAVLPEAPELNHNALTRRLQSAVIAADVRTAAERHEAARANRRVSGVRNLPDGMAALSLYGPLADVAAVDAAVESAARSARAAGDPRTLDQLRADALATMAQHVLATGDTTSPLGRTISTIVDSRQAEHVGNAPESRQADSADAAESAASDREDRRGDVGNGFASAPPPFARVAPLLRTVPVIGCAESAEVPEVPEKPEARVPESSGLSGLPRGGSSGPEVGPRTSAVSAGGMDADERGADVPAAGPSPAHLPSGLPIVARTLDPTRARLVLTITRDQLDSSTDDQPQPVDLLFEEDLHDDVGADPDRAPRDGPPSRPATGPPPTAAPPTLTPPTLTPPTPTPPPDPPALVGFGPLAPAVARELVARRQRWLRVEVEPRPPSPPPTWWDRTGASVDGYEIPPWLLRLVRVTHPTCVVPGCSVPSTRCDADHVVEWPVGATAEWNLRPLCRRHHILKTHGGFALTHDGQGGVLWSTPLGQRRHRAADGSVFRSPVPSRCR